jgi:hypothetical protein
MIEGLAFAAYPAKHRLSGVVTFVVGSEGIVHQKGQGKKAEEQQVQSAEKQETKLRHDVAVTARRRWSRVRLVSTHRRFGLARSHRNLENRS